MNNVYMNECFKKRKKILKQLPELGVFLYEIFTDQFPSQYFTNFRQQSYFLFFLYLYVNNRQNCLTKLNPWCKVSNSTIIISPCNNDKNKIYSLPVVQWIFIDKTFLIIVHAICLTTYAYIHRHIDVYPYCYVSINIRIYICTGMPTSKYMSRFVEFTHTTNNPPPVHLYLYLSIISFIYLLLINQLVLNINEFM